MSMNLDDLFPLSCKLKMESCREIRDGNRNVVVNDSETDTVGAGETGDADVRDTEVNIVRVLIDIGNGEGFCFINQKSVDDWFECSKEVVVCSKESTDGSRSGRSSVVDEI